jgi:hypothetical protein
MNRDHGGAAVRMPQKVVAAANANYVETGLLEGGEQLLVGSCLHQDPLHADELR